MSSTSRSRKLIFQSCRVSYLRKLKNKISKQRQKNIYIKKSAHTNQMESKDRRNIMNYVLLFFSRRLFKENGKHEFSYDKKKIHV